MYNIASTLIKNKRKIDVMNYNLDHLYCHQNDGNYIRANAGADMATIRKEIKQLKAMLLLHLDLIQEQSDQLMSKDKLLANLRQENEMLKMKIERSDRRTKINNNKREHQLPGTVAVDVPVNCNEMPEIKAKCDILKKISTKLLSNCTLKLNTLSQIVEEDSKFGVCEIGTVTEGDPNRNSANGVNLSEHTATDLNAIAPTATVNSIIGESNGKLIHKIVLQKVQAGDIDGQILLRNEDIAESHSECIESPKGIRSLTDIVTFKESESEIRTTEVQGMKNENNMEQFESCDKIHKHNIEEGNKDGFCKNEPQILLKEETEKQCQQMEPEDQTESQHLHFDDEELRKALLGSPIGSQHKRRRSIDDQDYIYAESSSTKRSFNRGKFMTAKSLYPTREWKMDELEAELNRQIAETGEDSVNQDECFNLEIPKWVIKESSGLYSIEGTEDLSDDVFLKRHARLEYDERRRKKWDVQRIREQRTIERLKRRFCKEEVDDPNQNPESILSFYPPAENIKFIQITDDLPVQAFGEQIPVIHRSDFALPWHHKSSSCVIISQTQSGPIPPLPPPLTTAASSSGLLHHSSCSSTNDNKPPPNVSMTSTTIVFAPKKKINRRQYAVVGSSTSPPLAKRRVIGRRNKSRR